MVYRLHCVNPILWLEHIITAFIHFTSFIGTGPAWAYYWGSSCFLGQTWNHDHGCCGASLWFTLRVGVPLSFFSLSLSSSLPISLQFLFRAITLLYYYSIEPGCYSDFMSLWYIVALIPLLNSFTNDLLLYLLSLATILNFYTNSSIVFPSCSNLLNSATFIDCLFFPPNSFLMSTKNSSMFLYSSNPSFKSSSSMFSF